jgi:quercetin dioxygenase-like cupin family protein
MTARLHRFTDALAFQPEGHSGVSPVRLTGATADESLNVVLSSYEPGARAELSPVALDTVYLVLTGRLTVTLDDQVIELAYLDSLFLPEGCVRAVENRTAEPASMFVIRPNP